MNMTGDGSFPLLILYQEKKEKSRLNLSSATNAICLTTY